MHNQEIIGEKRKQASDDSEQFPNAYLGKSEKLEKIEKNVGMDEEGYKWMDKSDEEKKKSG